VQAVAAYTAQFLGNVTAYPDVFAVFLSKLLNYHFILRRCAACTLRYNTWQPEPSSGTAAAIKCKV
jgi:hypothetical protein